MEWGLGKANKQGFIETNLWDKGFFNIYFISIKVPRPKKAKM